MAKVHQYILVLTNGTYEITKSNGPIGSSQTRQEVGGQFDSFDPKLGVGFRAQYPEDGELMKLPPNPSFEGISGKVLIGRVHGAEMWGLSADQQALILGQLKIPQAS